MLCNRVAPYRWHVQVHIGAHLLPVLLTCAAVLAADIVIDHFGMVPVTTELGDLPVASLRRLLDTGKVWVKLSAPYRLRGIANGFVNAGTLARELVAANPERVLWGSDWPHTPPHGHRQIFVGEPAPFRQVDTRTTLAVLGDWITDDSVRCRILVDNPALLYGFAATTGKSSAEDPGYVRTERTD